jgi:predicted transcriptional regulator
MTQVSSLEIPTELKAAIAEIAERAHRPEADVAADAVRAYLLRNAEYLRRVRAGLESADRGDFVPDDEMEATFARLTAES